MTVKTIILIKIKSTIIIMTMKNVVNLVLVVIDIKMKQIKI